MGKPRGQPRESGPLAGLGENSAKKGRAGPGPHTGSIWFCSRTLQNFWCTHRGLDSGDLLERVVAGIMPLLFLETLVFRPTRTNTDLVVQSHSPVQLFVTPWTATRQASMSITNTQSLHKFMFIASVMLSHHLIP